ncbi:hypothetical protein [Mycobacterium sp. 155]|uniref:hypothetical protein n=1 Tax=Mycobacterium sp. 155 TaxID=1157943 RepID=UPI00035FD6F8|nr:hypothetical protein [Mycobacterium sp. 155]
MTTEELPAGDAERIARVVALQLVPSNLHYLAALSCLVSHSLREPVSSDVADSIAAIESKVGISVAQMSEAFTGLPVVEVPFFKSTYTVLQGITTDSGTVIRHLLPAIFGRFRHQFPETFVRNVDAAARFLLLTSDFVTAHTGLELFDAPPPLSALRLPTGEDAKTLAEALILDEAEFFDGLPAGMVEYLQSMFFADTETLPARDTEGVEEALIERPFLRTGEGKVVIAAPHELMVTLRHAICIEATAHDCHALLLEALTAHATRLTGQLCESLFDAAPQVNSAPGSATLRGVIDGDKALEFRAWIPTLESSASSVFGDFLTLAPPAAEPNDAGRQLTVDVFWPLGRDFQLLTPNEQMHLCTTFEDLETVLNTPGTKQLSLWYFAEALDRLSETAETVLHSGLAELYGYYVEGEESFYEGDDSPPSTALVIDGDYAASLRHTATRRAGRRFVNIANVVHESLLCHGESTSVREVIAWPRIIFSADFEDFAIWVELEVQSSSDAYRTRTLAEALAYWAFHVYAEQPELFSTFDRDVQILLKPSDWSEESDPRWIRPGPAVEGKDLTFEFRPPQKPAPPAPANALDRELVAEFVFLLRNINGSAQPGDQSDSLLESLAPPGERRMIHVVRSDTDPLAWPGALPPARTISKACVAQLLDEVGTHLRLDCNRAVGDIADTERTAVLNDEVVAFLRDKLAESLGKYDFPAMLQYLIQANEALLHQQYVERARYPARLACFGQDSDEVRDLAKWIGEMSTASVSSRFLIEYCAALQPPSAAAPTLEGYEKILAIASEVVNKGFLSDAIHVGLSNAQLMILESGRLGISRDTDHYMKGLQSLLSANAQAIYDDATRPEGEPDDEKGNDDRTAADHLATVEWGFSFTDVTSFAREIVGASLDAGQEDVGSLSTAHVRQVMSSTLDWDEKKISALLDELTMTREPDFWSLGPEAFPWRYNRARSYLRRPLIASTIDGTDHVMFGHRNTLRTSFELHGQYLSGRLKARTSEMKTALSAATDRKGTVFEERVVEYLQGWCKPVRRRARRFGPHDLRNIGGKNLGDVDIVAFHEDTNTLFLIEAKALLVARTPREMANELGALLVGPKSAVERLRLRHEWVSDNLNDVLQELRITPTSTVTLTPLIVIDADLLTQQFNSPYPVITATNLKQPLQ